MTRADAAEQLAAATERLRRLGARVWRHIEDELGLSPMHAHVLEAIGEGATQVSTVADACGRHVSSASRLVDTLVGRGLVTRVEDAADRRAVVLGLTAEGRRAATRITEVQRSFLARVLDRMEPDDVAALTATFARFAEAAELTADEELGASIP